MLFPQVTKVVYAADGTGYIKAKLDLLRATRAVRKRRARKISDNLIQYKQIWKDFEPITLNKDENIILVGTVSKCSKRCGWLKVKDKSAIEIIYEHNREICRIQLPNLLY